MHSYVLLLGASVFVSLLVVGGMAGGIIFYRIAPSIIRRLTRLMEWAESRLQRMPTTDIVAGIAGLLAGLLIANLLSLPFGRLLVVGPFIPVLANVLLGYIGMNVAVKKKEELWGFLISIPLRGREKDKETAKHSVEKHRETTVIAPKVLDTSVIIDGRIADVAKSGFLEGPLVIPTFVLQELRHIADSSDVLKRNRGRRGLDILNRIQKELDVEVVISDLDYDDISEVDSKLLRLSQDIQDRFLPTTTTKQGS